MPRGGKRPGAGARKGNTNALKTGRSSAQVRRLVDALARVPEARRLLLAQHQADLRQQRKARRLAAGLLALLLDGTPAEPQALDRLENDQQLFAALMRQLLSGSAQFRKNDQTPYSAPQNDQSPGP